MSQDPPGFDTPSEALAGYYLSVRVLFFLIDKKVISKMEAIEAIEGVLLNLETFQHKAGREERKEAFEGARALLESLRSVIS